MLRSQQSSASLQPSTRNATLFAVGCALLLIAGIVHAGWMCEDAFITLRTVDNWVNGFGLRWNVAERVQSYTHPLWMLCLTPVYWLTRSPTLGLLVPSVIFFSLILTPKPAWVNLVNVMLSAVVAAS